MKKKDTTTTKENVYKSNRNQTKNTIQSSTKRITGGSIPVSECRMTTSRHSFDTNPLDHCETPKRAYMNIQNVLMKIGKERNQGNDVRIWDPYYCDGSVQRHLQELGFRNILHENQDFYQRIEGNKEDIPPHDIFLTNPPYSGNHIERLLTYLKTTQQPFCVLLPNWVARKVEYKTWLSDTKLVIYLSPIVPYTYCMPSWTTTMDRPDHVGPDGHTTPYQSSWYIHAGSDHSTECLLEELNGIPQKEWVVAKTIRGLKWKIQKQVGRNKSKKR